MEKWLARLEGTIVSTVDSKVTAALVPLESGLQSLQKRLVEADERTESWVDKLSHASELERKRAYEQGCNLTRKLSAMEMRLEELEHRANVQPPTTEAHHDEVVDLNAKETLKRKCSIWKLEIEERLARMESYSGNGGSQFSIKLSPSSSLSGSPCGASFSLFRGNPNYIGDSYGQEFAQAVQSMLREEDNSRSRARLFRAFGHHY